VPGPRPCAAARGSFSRRRGETRWGRNAFLAGAFELRSGIPEGAPPKTGGPDVVRAMTTGLFLDFLDIRMDSKKADSMAFKINLVTPDNGEKYLIELSNETLTNIEGYQADDADLTITIDRADLEQTMMGVKPLTDQITDGTAKTEGNQKVLDQLASMMVDFELGFEIIPGTKGPASKEDLNPFEVGPVEPVAE
jgi:alkyl sulfatase BDS1-like metallo-beta-lactamase superfamily hydrolase